MRILNLLFGIRNDTKSAKQSAQEVVEKTEQLQQEVHREKNKYTADLLKIQKQARIVKRETEKLIQITDTAYYIAKATGGLK